MLKRIANWWRNRGLVRVVVAVDHSVDRSIAVVEVYPHDSDHAWNAFRHFKEVYGGANVTCASRRILRLGRAPKEIQGRSLAGPVVPRRAPGDPRLVEA